MSPGPQWDLQEVASLGPETLSPVAWVKGSMRSQGSLEDRPKPEKAGTPEFYNHEDRLQGEPKTDCEKFQVTELWRPVWVSQSESERHHHQHGALRLVFALRPTFIEKKLE